MVSKRRLLQIAIAIVSILPPHAAGQGTFPVPRAEGEFGELASFARYLAYVTEQSPEAFIRLVGPHAPLSLSVSKGTPEETARLQNLYLGVVGSAFALNPVRIPNEFHCGPPCTSRRRNVVQETLTEIRALCEEVRELEGLDLIAIWGIPGDYRINNLFCLGGQTNEAVRSPVMGFLPSSDWTSWPNTRAYLESRSLGEGAVMRLVTKLKSLPFVAIQVADHGVYAIGSGLADNESGVWFGEAPIAEGGLGPNGGVYTVVQELEPGAWYYETS